MGVAWIRRSLLRFFHDAYGAKGKYHGGKTLSGWRKDSDLKKTPERVEYLADFAISAVLTFSPQSRTHHA